MDFKLHQAICHANNAIGNLMNIEFSATHHMSQAHSIREARNNLANAAAELNAYEAKLSLVKPEAA